jgi:hypothetical protein
MRKLKKVIINNNDEIGNELFSISLIEDPEDWIQSFKTLKTAIRFCHKEGFEIDKFRRTVYGKI